MSPVGPNHLSRRHPGAWLVTPTVLLTSLCAVGPATAGPQVVIIPDAPRDQFDCSNSELTRKRYQTAKACLTDLCGDVFSADRFSLYVEHPRSRALVRNPCYMLTYAAE
jgi:hypothetical protein